MREKSVHAAFVLRGLEDELSFAAFLRNGIVVTDRYGAIRVAVCSEPEPKDCEIDCIGKQGSPDHEDNDP